MSIYYTIALLVFLVIMAVLLIRYVNTSVDKEFRNLARAVSDKEYRGGELTRVDQLLADRLPIPPDIKPLAPSSGGRGLLPPALMALGVILLWGGLFAQEESATWLYGGMALILAAILIMLVTLQSRKWERVARLLRFRADLRRLDGNHAGAASDLRELVKLTPRDDAAWAELSDDLSAQGDLEDAVDAIRQAIRLDPRYDEYRMIEASLCIRLGHLDVARKAIGEWASLAGVGHDDPRLIIYQAALDLAEGRKEKAAESLRGIVGSDDEQYLEFLESDQALAGVKDMLPSRR